MHAMDDRCLARWARFAVVSAGLAVAPACSSSSDSGAAGGGAGGGVSFGGGAGGGSVALGGSGGVGGSSDAGAMNDADGATITSDAGPARMRPRILIALHGSNGLANNADWDSRWTYVREHLDGFWGNNAGISAAEEAALWKKIAGRTLITEWDSVDKAHFVSPDIFTGAESFMPAVVVNREQICLYADPVSLWDGTTVADAIANYVTNPAVAVGHRFKSVCTGFQPFAQGALTGAALAAFNNSAATFVEYPATAWTLGGQKDNFTNAWKATHAKGSAFIWFDSIYPDTTIHDWLTSTQAAYSDFQAMGLLQPNDVILLMNYSGRLPSVPEAVGGIAAESTTGIAYWLLHQP
jgi:hypothetical protein